MAKRVLAIVDLLAIDLVAAGAASRSAARFALRRSFEFIGAPTSVASAGVSAVAVVVAVAAAAVAARGPWADDLQASKERMARCASF